MSTRNRKSFWERFAYKELSKIGPGTDDPIEQLTDQELRSIRQIKIGTLIKAASVGAAGVVILYAPYYFFGQDLFPIRKLDLPFSDFSIDIEYEFYGFSLILVLIEIWYLNFLNIRTVAKIARACGFPDEINENYENNLSALIAVGLEKKHKQLQSIGINPYMGLSKWKLFAYQIAIRFKALLTNILFKMLIRRLLGRYALRAVIDLVGIPVYAFWNAYASSVIIREALVRIMAPPLIKKFVDQIYADHNQNDDIKQIVYDSLQSISVSKRSYHYNHFLLSISLLNKFNIPVKENPYFIEDFHDYIRSADPEVKIAYSKVLVFGIIIDGKVSKREIILLKKMQAENIIPYTIEEIKSWASDFEAGKGLKSFIYR